MAIAVHLVTTPSSAIREAYEAAWRRTGEEGEHRPPGRRSHTAWLVDDVLHVVEVWDSRDDMARWTCGLAPVLEDVGLVLDGPPVVGDLLQAEVGDLLPVLRSA